MNTLYPMIMSRAAFGGGIRWEGSCEPPGKKVNNSQRY